MIKKILEIVAQRLNALATKVFKKESYPYPPLTRRERRKFERDNKKAEKNIALCRRCMKDASFARRMALKLETAEFMSALF